MYITVAQSLQEHQAKVRHLSEVNALLHQQYQSVEKQLHDHLELHDLQIKERNILLVELTDQLTVMRKKLLKEKKIREHIQAHDATVRIIDKHPLIRNVSFMIRYYYNY